MGLCQRVHKPLWCPVELGHLHERAAHFVGGVGVADSGCQEAVLLGELIRLPVVAFQVVAGVEDLDDVRVGYDLLQCHFADDGPAEPVERVGDRYQPALVLDSVDGLHGGQVSGN